MAQRQSIVLGLIFQIAAVAQTLRRAKPDAYRNCGRIRIVRIIGVVAGLQQITAAGEPA